MKNITFYSKNLKSNILALEKKKKKKKSLQYQNRGKSQNTSNEFEPKENYRINFKCLPYIRLYSDRIQYLPDYSSTINSQKEYNDYRYGCIDIYVSKPRDEMISEIKEAAVKENQTNLLLRGLLESGKLIFYLMLLQD